MSARTEVEAPRIEDAKPLLIAGLREPIQSVAKIPEIWQRAMAYKFPHQVGRAGYGLCFDCMSDNFEYLAGVEVSDFSGLPTELSRTSIPAQKYAVFSHQEHVSQLSRTIEKIMSEWLPNSGYQLARATREFPDFFERYSEEFNPRTGVGGIEVWIPVRS
jgi:AraC family transcriptional regulator